MSHVFERQIAPGSFAAASVDPIGLYMPLIVYNGPTVLIGRTQYEELQDKMMLVYMLAVEWYPHRTQQ